VYFNIKSDQLKEKNKEPNSIEQKYAKDIKWRKSVSRDFWRNFVYQESKIMSISIRRITFYVNDKDQQVFKFEVKFQSNKFLKQEVFERNKIFWSILWISFIG
jgi:hypothetical protein